MRKLNLVGHVFHRLTVLQEVARPAGSKHVRWQCRCECGAVTEASTLNLRSGGVKSCGCLRDERVRESCQTHGHTGTPTYATWRSMIWRCGNVEEPYYGGQGVTVCKRWLRFEHFLADMGERPSGKTLDRIDSAKGYTPGNCRWATPKQQSQNRRPRRWKVRPQA